MEDFSFKTYVGNIWSREVQNIQETDTKTLHLIWSISVSALRGKAIARIYEKT